MVSYNFDRKRDHTISRKWKSMYQAYPNVDADVTPMTVADMEFENPPEIVEGLESYLGEITYGYNLPSDNFFESVIRWQKEKNQLILDKEDILYTPGVVPGLIAALSALTKTGEGVILFSPVYGSYYQIINSLNRNLVDIPLLYADRHYEIDFAAFEEAAANPNNRALLFCNPHNPVGRVWTQSELERLVAICSRYNLYLISDEIWCDFVFCQQPYRSLLTVDENFNDHIVVCTSAAKSFNLGGLKISTSFIKDKDVRNQVNRQIRALHYDVTAVGFEAMRLGYDRCGNWLDQVKQVIYRNFGLVQDFFRDNLAQIYAPIPEGTYTVWLDCRDCFHDEEEKKEFENFLFEQAQFIVTRGENFGPNGWGFYRVNVAMPTASLEDNLRHFKVALDMQTKR